MMSHAARAVFAASIFVAFFAAAAVLHMSDNLHDATPHLLDLIETAFHGVSHVLGTGH